MPNKDTITETVEGAADEAAEPADIAETIHEGCLPAALYRRGVMEPPPEAMLTLRSRHNCKTVIAEIEVPAMDPLFSISPVMTWGYGPPLLMPRPRSIGLNLGNRTAASVSGVAMVAAALDAELGTNQS